MYSFVNTQSIGSDALWSWSSARRELDDALHTLDDAGAALVGLIDDSDWRSDGVRALNEVLSRVRQTVRVEVGQLRMRAGELDAAVVV